MLGASRCPTCAPHQTTAERGYNAAHQAKRAALLATAYGQPCARCGLPMLPGQPLDLDHTDDRAGYRGMSHQACNRAAGGRKRASEFRQAPTMTPGRPTSDHTSPGPVLA